MRIAVLGTVLVALWMPDTRAQPPGTPTAEPAHKGKTLSTWIEQLTSRQPGERGAAYDAIIAIGEPAIPHLVGRFGDRDPALRFYCGVACGKLGKPALEPLLKALDSDDHRVVAAAAAGVGMIGGDAAPAIPKLIRLMREARIADAETGTNARDSLGRIGKPAVKPLVEIITAEQSGPLLAHAILALGMIGPDAAPAVPRLREIYTESRRLGGQTPAVIQRRSIFVKNTAHALGLIGPAAEAALPDLLPGIDDMDAEVQAETLTAVGLIGAGKKDLIGPLVKKFTHPQKMIRRAAATAVARVGPGAVDELMTLIGSTDKRVRSAAIFAIGDLGVLGCPAEKLAPVLKPVRGALTDNDDFCRLAGAYAAGALGDGDSQTVKALVALLRDGDTGVRCASAEALGRLGPKAKDAVPVLKIALDDTDADVRRAAEGAVRKITELPAGGK